MTTATPGGTAGRPLSPRWFLWCPRRVRRVSHQRRTRTLGELAHLLGRRGAREHADVRVSASASAAARPPSTGRSTGRTLRSPHPPNAAPYAARTSTRWIGGANSDQLRLGE